MGGMKWSALTYTSRIVRVFPVFVVTLLLVRQSTYLLCKSGNAHHAVKQFGIRLVSVGAAKNADLGTKRLGQRLFIESQRAHKGVGLGNHLFWFASLLGIAKTNNLVPAMPAYDLAATIFNLSDPELLDSRRYGSLVSKAQHLPDTGIYSRICCIYLPFTEHLHLLPEKDIVLKGAFQSWRYFHPHMQAVIKSQLRFSDQVMDLARAHLLEVRRMHPPMPERSEPSSIGIHVRRGDITSAYYEEFGVRSPPASYYMRSREFMEQRHPNRLYVVVSDDLSWARSRVRGKNVAYLNESRADVSLAVLTLMDHLILSVGSFSWWSAYLSNATDVVYYNDNPRPGTSYDVMYRAEDYWLPQWIPL